MQMRRKILVMLALVLSVVACKDDGKTSKAAQTPLVQAIAVELQDVPLSFEFAARAQGSKETQVRARVGGILLKRNYVEGSDVEEGSVLFEIDPEPYKVVLAQAQAKLAQINAQLKAAESQWERVSTLYKQKIVSEKSRDEARANMDSLVANKQMAEAEVQSAQLNLDYTTVRAPISGITSMETQSEGSLISGAGDASLLTTITQLNPIYVIFSASENEILSLSNMVDSGLVKNPDNKKDIKAKVKFSNGVLYPLEGEINFINPSIDEKTGTIKLRAVFPNPEKRLMPGQFLRLLMEGLTRINALLVPQEAVMQNGAGSFVYRVNSNGVLESVQVRTGLLTKDGKWIIDDGLNAGDVIVTQGLMQLRPGMSVKTNVALKNVEVYDVKE